MKNCFCAFILKKKKKFYFQRVVAFGASLAGPQCGFCSNGRILRAAEQFPPLRDELRMMLKAPTRGGDGANSKRPAVPSAAFICLCSVEAIPRIYETFQPGERDYFHVLSVFFLHLLDAINQVIKSPGLSDLICQHLVGKFRFSSS